MKHINCNQLIQIASLTAIVLLLSIAPGVMSQEKENFIIHFDISSIEHIFNDPESILENTDEFWKSDPAYRLSDGWHKGTSIPKEPEKLNRRLQKLAAMEKSERLSNRGYKLALDFYEMNGVFQENAVAHVTSFLPNLDRISCESTVYVTAYTKAHAFAADGNSVISTTNGYWGGDLNKVLNCQAHELFHVGYGYNRHYRKEKALDNAMKYGFLDQLQNEGIATYVGYTIQDLFPCKEKDHIWMDDPDVLKEKLAMVNNIFRQVDSLEAAEIRQISWDDGVMARAYYVTGGHMARTIDQKLGRDALVETIANGPLFFVDTYNALVPQDERIIRFSDPDPDLP